MPRANGGWTTEEEYDETVEQFFYEDNEDEDEFGLPSISSVRRKSKRIPANKSNDLGGGMNTTGTTVPTLSSSINTGRGRANSTDIAEERGPPSYPTAKKSEGKILRPQYKDILRGTCDSARWLTGTEHHWHYRSREFLASYKASIHPTKCNPQRI